MTGLIPSWSFSRLKDFEKCPYMLWLKSVKKQSTEHMDMTAADRGTQIHQEAEDFVRGKGDFTKNLAKFADYFKKLKQEFEAGTAMLEDNWGFDIDWQPTGWWDDNVWCRMKLDNFRVIEGTPEEPIVGVATDYKTGKKFGNEVSHNQQGQIYTVGSFMRYPSLEFVDPVFVYLDHGQTSKPKRYTREKAMKFLAPWNERALKLTEATEFPPKPNKINCKFCPFGPNKGDGSCDWGVDG